jgi:hypothetical protein
MPDRRASKTLDDLLTVLLDDSGAETAVEVDAAVQTEMKAMVASTSALIDKLHRERTMRRLAEAEQARMHRAVSNPLRGREGPLPSKEQLVAELCSLVQAAGREAAFHALKFQDARPEDIAEMITSLKHLLEGKGE